MEPPASPLASTGLRIRWLDGIKGLAILWIAYFHCFETYLNKRLPSPLGADYFSRFIAQTNPHSATAFIVCILEAIYAAIAGVGFHAVGVFIVMSGFGLAYSLSRTGGPSNGWRGWYRSRLVRLFPMYWAAHLLYLVSPWIARLEPIDYRFFLSLLGDRVYPIYYIFYYLNAAWWYFGLILELYVVFPILYELMRRLGAGWFLALAIVETVASRYIILFILHASGYYTLGAFFGCRLWEFALGMVIGVWYQRDRACVDVWLFSWSGLIAGAAIYTAGLYTYESSLAYTLTDALIGTGLFVILAQLAWQSRRIPLIETAIAYVGVWSYGFYLIHQPYVIYFGTRMRALSMVEFAVAVIPLIGVLALAAGVLERGVNRIADRALTRGTRPATPAVQSAEASS